MIMAKTMVRRPAKWDPEWKTVWRMARQPAKWDLEPKTVWRTTSEVGPGAGDDLGDGQTSEPNWTPSGAGTGVVRGCDLAGCGGGGCDLAGCGTGGCDLAGLYSDYNSAAIMLERTSGNKKKRKYSSLKRQVTDIRGFSSFFNKAIPRSIERHNLSSGPWANLGALSPL